MRVTEDQVWEMAEIASEEARRWPGIEIVPTPWYELGTERYGFVLRYLGRDVEVVFSWGEDPFQPDAAGLQHVVRRAVEQLGWQPDTETEALWKAARPQDLWDLLASA